MSSSGWDTAGYSPPEELGLSSTYLEAIRYINDSPGWLHRPSGRAVAIGDDIFYSPNSSFTPDIPPPAEQQLIHDPSKDSIDEFHQPRWWTHSAAYLPFLPTLPNLHLPPFHVLFHDPDTRRRNHVQMCSGDVLEWANLEQRLKRIIQQFQSGYGIPASQTIPIVSTTLACQGTYQRLNHFVVAEKQSRDWFSVWMAIISFCISVAQVTDGEDDSVMCPAWFHCLVRHVDERTASGLRQQLSQFTGAYPRAGIFLNLLEDASIQRPTVDFYVRYRIPLWYPWGHREEELARANPSGFSRFVPPPHLLQAARMFLIKQLPVIQVSNDRPWEIFFEECKRRRAENVELIPRKKPVLKNFLWEKNSEGEWTRVLAYGKDKEAILQAYGRHQKVFDEWTNEWDCCMAMGSLDSDEIRTAYYDNDETVTDLPVQPGFPTRCRKASAAFLVTPDDSLRCHEHTSERLISSIPSSGSNQQSLFVVPSGGYPFPSRSDWHYMSSAHHAELYAEYCSSTQANGDEYRFTESYDPTNILRLFYGFVPPPYPENWCCLQVFNDDGIDTQNLAKGIGKKRISSSYVESSLGQAAIKFFWSISQKDFVPPSNEMYDLAYNNTRSIKKSPRLSYLRKLPGDIFIFIFKDCATMPWSIAVTNIVDAMFILRLDHHLNDYQIANQLLIRGVCFLTLLQLPVFDAIAPPTSIPRIRLSTYMFSLEDYDAYCHERNEMLCNPRIARGALKCGSILWHLAVGTASFHDVLSGPSSAVTLRHQCMSLNPGDKLMWCDDSLDQTEIDILCGVYYVFTAVGQASQQATKSWWPPVQVWENNTRLGFWNEEYESFYTSRLKELQSGAAVPFNSDQWHTKIRPFAVVRRAFDHTSKSASILLHSVSHGL